MDARPRHHRCNDLPGRIRDGGRTKLSYGGANERLAKKESPLLFPAVSAARESP
jgi:hypothetical protein